MARVTGMALTLGEAYALCKTPPLEQLVRDEASALIMLPSSYACPARLGIIGLGLDVHIAIRALKHQREHMAVPDIW